MEGLLYRRVLIYYAWTQENTTTIDEEIKTRNGDVKTVDLFCRVEKHRPKVPYVGTNSLDRSVRSA
ncbi:hypothetical protein DRN77_02060 [Methanosarcinales archaeon]|nr:MAG: hypothetical protein DRN77_02060 [Methanosarcinales archaeon]